MPRTALCCAGHFCICREILQGRRFSWFLWILGYGFRTFPCFLHKKGLPNGKDCAIMLVSVVLSAGGERRNTLSGFCCWNPAIILSFKEDFHGNHQNPSCPTDCETQFQCRQCHLCNRQMDRPEPDLSHRLCHSGCADLSGICPFRTLPLWRRIRALSGPERTVCVLFRGTP